MAWTESHTVLIRHRKLVELATALRIRPAHAIGHLHALWHAALEQQEDGDLSAWSDEFIAHASDYPGDAPQYVRLLQKYRWLDGRIIHDWLDYAGRYLEVKYRTRNPAKLLEIQRKHTRQARDRPEADSGRTQDGQPNQPNLPNQPTEGSARAREVAAELPTRAQAVDMTATAGVDPEFAAYAFDDWFTRGGRDGANVEVPWLHYATKRWTRERKEWQEGTHKGRRTVPQAAQNGASTVVLSKELDRVIERMKTIKATYGDHQSWTQQDVDEFNKLKLRRGELRQVLGVKA